MHNFNEYRQNGNKDFDRLEDFVLPFRTCLQHGSFEWNEGGEQETEEGSAGFRALWEQGGAAASHFAARSKNINDSNMSNHKIVLLCANFWIDYIFLYSMRKKRNKIQIVCCRSRKCLIVFAICHPDPQQHFDFIFNVCILLLNRKDFRFDWIKIESVF